MNYLLQNISFDDTQTTCFKRYPWSLYTKGDPAQLHGRLFESTINISMSILDRNKGVEIKYFEVNRVC